MTQNLKENHNDMDEYSDKLEQKETDEDPDAIRYGLEQSLQGLGRLAEDFFQEFEMQQSL